MRISNIFHILAVLLTASATGFGQPHGPPPHDMEPPEGVPPSLLELASEMKGVRGAIAETLAELHEAMEKDPGSGFGGHFDQPLKYSGRARRKGRNHETIREIHDLRGEAGRIAREAWGIVRELAEERKKNSVPPLPPERRKELERWMMGAFGPPPREHGPFPWNSKHMGSGHSDFHGFQGKTLFDKIDRMEKRIEELEKTVRAQEKEIRELRRASERKGSPEGQGE